MNFIRRNKRKKITHKRIIILLLYERQTFHLAQTLLAASRHKIARKAIPNDQFICRQFSKKLYSEVFFFNQHISLCLSIDEICYDNNTISISIIITIISDDSHNSQPSMMLSKQNRNRAYTHSSTHARTHAHVLVDLQ